VRENYQGYTKREVLRAKEAHCAQAMIGNPSKGDFKGMVSSNMINDCSITPSDIANAKEIFGPALTSVRGQLSPACEGKQLATHLHQWWKTTWQCLVHWWNGTD
jgi:hypothetical protein